MFNPQFLPKNFEVHEKEPLKTDTGLLSANGMKIFKIEFNEPIGFIHFADKE